MGRLVTELHHVYPILVLTIVLAACIHFVWLIAKTRRHYKQLKEFGGPKPQSVLGNLADVSLQYLAKKRLFYLSIS